MNAKPSSRKQHETNDPADLYARDAHTFREPPQGIGTTLRYLGPGLILVGSIVGSGELIMTTKLGAQAGFALLWFVLLSCVIKTVVQAELGRHVISSGETILVMFNKLPGPRGRRPGWLCLEWLLIVVVSTYLGLGLWSWDQAAGIGAGGLAAGVLSIWIAAALLLAMRSRQREMAQTPDAQSRPMLGWFLWLYLACQLVMFINVGAVMGGAGQALALGFENVLGTTDAKLWTAGVAVVCGALLLVGRYKMLERVSLALVLVFTLITFLCTALLYWTDNAITFEQIRHGFQFSFPEFLGMDVTLTMIVLTALGMYAGTGIGTWEMMHYTYWCVEKGYARHTGANQPGDQWTQRARGWIRVMYTDVLLTMAVFTISTVCFYLLGAAILYPELDPAGKETLGVLQHIFTESLGPWAATLFVVGGFVVLFSTTYSGTAGSSRLVSDALCVMGVIDARDYGARLRFTRFYIVFGLTMGTVTYCLLQNPPLMLIISGFVAVVLYPVFGLGTLYLRYRAVDERIRPGPFTTSWLWICGLALAVISPAAGLLVLALNQGWLEF
ncbi:MAG: Nramp family divalent metal transporter [Acidobacteriota bacterium]|nr:Nramp family divalent metal transporter [Acidobacteriota bacterium]